MGGGNFSICAIIRGQNIEEINEEIDTILDQGPDMIEWRSDYYNFSDVNSKCEIINLFNDKIPDLPIMYTPYFEDIKKEERELHIQGLLDFINKTKVDMINLNFFDIDDIASHLIDEINNKDMYAILTKRYLNNTPSIDEMMGVLLKMKYLGADVVQLVTKPKDYNDVLSLFRVTNEFNNQENTLPLITTSLTNIGLISRIVGFPFGSTLAYAYTNAPTIDGQIKIKELKEIYKILEKYNI